MKNRFIFIIGLIILLVLIWATTMLAIEHNYKKEETLTSIIRIYMLPDN